MFKKRLILILVAIAGSIAAFQLTQGTASEVPVKAPPYEPAIRDKNGLISAAGLVESMSENTSLGSAYSGIASEVNVKVWDKISRGQFRPAAILRVVIGNRHKPLYTGPTHVQDFTEAIRQMVSFPVVRLTDPDQIALAYFEAHEALHCGRSTMLVEHKDLI